MRVDLERLKELIRLMNDNDLVELEVEEEGVRVRLCKEGRDVSPAPVVIPHAAAASAPAEAASEGAQSAGAGDEGCLFIKAPMVGTFYRAPAPDEAPFVEVGDEVDEDTVVCIIEAMKVMNEVKAGLRGKVEEILVENGMPVEYGQPLMKVSPV